MAMRIGEAGYGRTPMPGARPVKSLGGLLHPGPDTTTAAGPRAVARHRLAAPPAPARDRRPRGQLRRARRGPRARVRPRPRRLLAVVAGEPARVRARPPRGGDGPARLRLLRDARARTSRSSTTRAGPSELLDALGIESAAVVGNSMGGFVGAELAIAAPERACSGSWSSRAADLLAEPAPRPAAGAARAAVGRGRGARARARRPTTIATRRRLRYVGARHGGLPLPAV